MIRAERKRAVGMYSIMVIAESVLPLVCDELGINLEELEKELKWEVKMTIGDERLLSPLEIYNFTEKYITD